MRKNSTDDKSKVAEAKNIASEASTSKGGRSAVATNMSINE